MELSVLLDDLPTLEDKLAWECELQRITGRIANCPTPHVLGVHGNWGSGKTSFMRQLQHRLGGRFDEDGSVFKGVHFQPSQENKKIATVWFDAWRYQNELTPIVALLQEIRRQLSVMPMVKAKFSKLGTIALRYTLDSLSDVGKAIGIEAIPSTEKIQKIGEQWEAQHHAQLLNTDSIRKHLHDTILSLLPNGNQSRIVVFIDDLDRCNPKAAFRLLEGLKIYLNLPNCVFVLGMNENVLTDAIREEISAPGSASVGELNLRASHYLEKICTDIYRLPLPQDASALFSAMLSASVPQIYVDSFNICVGDAICLPPNPRRLKALANQWARFSGCIAFPEAAADQSIWAARVTVAAYIHQFHRDLWERWHFNPDFWVEFLAWCNGERSFSPEGLPIAPSWASALKLTTRFFDADTAMPPTWALQYPNPGDIDVMWIDELIRRYRDFLRPVDFKPLLAGKQLAR
ncbi:KAP family P-loop NTPase fold protein [Pseudomonas brassicacearum]|uniref:KAP family P-loop NTPase fold protein n=1 Tax=Pseudomonas brassicacearum TaxID=930166 RepID=UPI0009C051EC|nr:P-loop NTPase fold protein [Pseudomonas brassicacearum]